MISATKIILGLVGAVSLTTIASAQSDQIPARPQQNQVALVNARIYTAVPGQATIERGYVIFDKGVITAVGTGDAPTLATGCEKFDCAGFTVLPGFIHVGSQLGLVEVQQVSATDDRNEFGAFHPEIRACVAVNPDSDLIPVARSGGVLNTVVFPQSGVVAGHASVMRIDGWTNEDQTFTPRAGLVVNWPMTEPIVSPWMDKSVEDQKKDAAKNLKEIDTFFERARTWMLAREKDPKTEGDLRFENMIGVLKGEEPVYFVANSPGQIESAASRCFCERSPCNKPVGILFLFNAVATQPARRRVRVNTNTPLRVGSFNKCKSNGVLPASRQSYAVGIVRAAVELPP